MHDDAARAELTELYETWFKAVADRDLAFFERTLAPDWLYIDVSGMERSKPSYIQYVADLPSGIILKNPDLAVRAIGDIALVNGTYQIDRNVSGLTPTSTTRFTAVWRRHGDILLALLHHGTTIVEPSD